MTNAILRKIGVIIEDARSYVLNRLETEADRALAKVGDSADRSLTGFAELRLQREHALAMTRWMALMEGLLFDGSPAFLEETWSIASVDRESGVALNFFAGWLEGNRQTAMAGRALASALKRKLLRGEPITPQDLDSLTRLLG